MKLNSHCRACALAQNGVQFNYWTVDSEMNCELDYGLGSYSFHAVLFHPVIIPCTAGDEGLTPVEILYTIPEVTV